MLGLSVEELAGLTPFDFELKCNGFNVKQRREENLFRRVGFLSVVGHLDPKKHITIDKVWSLPGDENHTNVDYLDKVQMKKVLERYAQIRERRMAKEILN